jgi:hypothetical protein
VWEARGIVPAARGGGGRHGAEGGAPPPPDVAARVTIGTEVQQTGTRRATSEPRWGDEHNDMRCRLLFHVSMVQRRDGGGDEGGRLPTTDSEEGRSEDGFEILAEASRRRWGAGSLMMAVSVAPLLPTGRWVWRVAGWGARQAGWVCWLVCVCVCVCVSDAAGLGGMRY